MKRSRKTRTPMVERLEERLVLTLPFGALPTDTAEYLLGDVVVNVVLMESDGAASSEDWTPALIQAAKDKVEQGMDWWQQTLRNYEAQLGIPVGTNPLSFQFDYQFADTPVPTAHEPIAEVSQNFESWIEDFFAAAGITTPGDFNTRIREFNNNKRIEHGKDWSFTVFVVNDQNDFDHKFAADDGEGNMTEFRQAFAYAGGEFIITPASRPVSTFAHETGHIFWAKDEYAPNGSSYNDQRGYYDTFNHNALVDAPAGFQQQPSIMTSGTLMQTAFDQHISSTPTLEMIGWRDADHDGLFDVLLPHSLTGSGYDDSDAGVYRFLGNSHVNTLPNQNSSGNQSDITINLIREVQYRFDGGAWQTIDIADGPDVDLDLSIPVPQGGFETIELRTFDSQTNIASATEFFGVPSAPTSTETPGISGFVRYDVNGNGQADAGEGGLAGWTVSVVGGADNRFGNVVEPDDFAQGDPVTSANAFLSAQIVGNGPLLADNFVHSGGGNPASTGSQVFRFAISQGGGPKLLSEAWNENVRLNSYFFSPTSYVQIDAIGNSDGDYARLEIYNSSNQLIGRVTSQALQTGQVETLSLGRAEGDIAYAVAYGFNGTGVQFDNLHFGPPVSVVTDAQGAFSLPFLPDGLYALQVTPPSGGSVTGDAIQSVVYSASGTPPVVTFTGVVSASHNSANPYDVTGEGDVNLADIFAVLADLRANGMHAVTSSGGTPAPPFLDVNNDSMVDLLDIFAVLDYLRQGGGSGEPLSLLSGGDPTLGGGGATSDSSATSGGASLPGEPEPGFSPATRAVAVATGVPTTTAFTLDTSLPASASPTSVPFDPALFPFRYAVGTYTLRATRERMVVQQSTRNPLVPSFQEVVASNLAARKPGGSKPSESELLPRLAAASPKLDVPAVDHLFRQSPQQQTERRNDDVDPAGRDWRAARRKAAEAQPTEQEPEALPEDRPPGDQHEQTERQDRADERVRDEVFRELDRADEQPSSGENPAADAEAREDASPPVIDEQTLDLLSSEGD